MWFLKSGFSHGRHFDDVITDERDLNKLGLGRFTLRNEFNCTPKGMLAGEDYRRGKAWKNEMLWQINVLDIIHLACACLCASLCLST